jgi:putative phosphoesterase
VENRLMRIGLLSDTHDRVPAVRELLDQMIAGGVSIVMHAGDYCSPFTLQPFHDLSIPLLGVFGRNDGDHDALQAAAKSGYGATELYESPHSFDLGGKSALLIHDLADVHQRSIDGHEVVVHGFTHIPEMISRGDSLLVNPGEGCGWLHGAPTGAILDLDTKAVEFLKLSGSEWKY